MFKFTRVLPFVIQSPSFIYPTPPVRTPRQMELMGVIKINTLHCTPRVNLFCLPTAATAITVDALRDLYCANRIYHCVIVDCGQFQNKLHEEVNARIWKPFNQSPQVSSFAMSTLFNPPYFKTGLASVVVFDQFESLYDNYNTADIKNMVECMAINIDRNKSYSVQLNVGEKSKYFDLLGDIKEKVFYIT